MDAHALLWMLDQQVAAAKQRQQTAAAAVEPDSRHGAFSGTSSSSSGSSGSSGGGAISMGGSSEVGRLHRAALELGGPGSRQEAAGGAAAQEAVRYVASAGRELHQQFEKQAEAGGWRMHMTMLNPKETRLAVS